MGVVDEVNAFHAETVLTLIADQRIRVRELEEDNDRLTRSHKEAVDSVVYWQSRALEAEKELRRIRDS